MRSPARHESGEDGCAAMNASMSATRHRFPLRPALAALALAAAVACVPARAETIRVTPTGWPDVAGLDVLADGRAVPPIDGAYEVEAGSLLTVRAAGVELATLAAKPSLTLFDLLPQHDCSSSPALAKLLSLLLALDADGDPADGVTIPAPAQPADGVRLADLAEDDLLALETRLAGRSVALRDALLAANAALDQETWTESQARTAFVNDMSVLQSYLDRVFGALAGDRAALDGFSRLAPAQAAAIPATLRSQGLAFDGRTPVFAWRYGLQRAEPGTYAPRLTYPFALPADIQAIYAALADEPHYGHIGDIDIADGRLYAPIEDEDDSSQPSYIAVYDAATLQYTGEKHALPRAEHADGVPWVAVDAARNRLYTVTWSTAAADRLNVFDLATFAKLRSVPLQMSFDGRRVQGAKAFGGMLYASGDSKDAGAAPDTQRKYLYKIDPDSGAVITLLSYDEPRRSEAEGLAFDADGTLHVIVMAPYTTPLYAEGTLNPKPFDESYSIDGDDWNPSSTMRHFTRQAPPLRDRLCRP
jgi:hypothetical protein